MKETMTLPVFSETVPYGILKEQYKEGFAAFQKKYVMPRNTIMMVIFAILAVSMIAAAVSDPTNTLTYVLLMVCLAGIFVLWYNPRKQRRMILDVVEDLEQERYVASCDGTVLRIQIQQEGTEEETIPETRLLLENCLVKELETCYLICDGKRMFYVLPKEAIDSQNFDVSRETNDLNQTL